MERIEHWLERYLPEDCKQEIALTFLEYPNLTKISRIKLILFRYKILRHNVWDRLMSKYPKYPHCLRPSKLRKSKGYRKNHYVR